MNARPLALRATFVLLLLAAAVALPTAFASIGEAPSSIVGALGSYHPAPAAQGYTAGDGFQFRIVSANGIATAVHGSGTMSNANIGFASDLVGAATGYGQGIAGPVAQFFRTRLSALVGKGQVAIGVEEYELKLTVTGDGPFHVAFVLAPQTVDPASFPPAAHSLGPADAKHVIREFSDLQCPFCARFDTGVWPQLKAELMKRGDVRFEFHYFPLKSIHHNAVTAAETAECVTAANQPSSFWTYQDAVFSGQSQWSDLSDPVPALLKIAAGVGLSTTGVAQCVHDGTYSSAVENDYQIAINQLHLTGTPTLFVDNLKVGDYTKLSSYNRLLVLSDALRAQAAGSAAGGAGSASPSGGGTGP